MNTILKWKRKAVLNLFHDFNKYLLVTEFEVRNVSYGPSFFLFIYGPSAKCAGHKSTGKNEDP